MGLLVVILSLTALSAVPLCAQETRRVAHATLVDRAPSIDGVVDDPVWELAPPITGFVQAEPSQGMPASEQTVVRILYDSGYLYVGVICYDSDPGEILVTDSRRDSGMGDTDSFQMILDTYHDFQNGFVFGTNPAGIEFDGQVSDAGQGGRGGRAGDTAVAGSGSGFNLNWDGSWTVRTHVNEVGWMAEFAIRLRSLRYGDRPQTWGLNFQRNIRRKRETAYWAPIERAFNLYRLSSAGALEGLELDAPRNFKVTPYTIGTATRDFGNEAETETELDADFGLDVKFGVTPTLNLDITYNTDFAQVEVDEQIVNLTRFSVRLPEKRPFFLENAGMFAIGSNDVELFFSRRIGIDPSGLPVPILGGARLSGKVGAFNLGLLSMQTDDIPDVTPQNSFTVARVSREFPNRSSLGGMVVSRDAAGAAALRDDWNRTWGLDGKLGIGDYTNLQGFAARTETPGRRGLESAYNVLARYSQNGGTLRFRYTQVGDEFNPEVGFFNRFAYRQLQTGSFKNFRFPNIPWLRELRTLAFVNTYWNLDGFMESQTIQIDVNLDFESGWFFSPGIDIEQEGLTEPFEISPGVIVPPGSYRHPEIDWRFDSDRSRALSFTSSLRVGGFYTGNQRTFGIGLVGRRGSKLTGSVTWNRSDVNLPQGEFVTNLVRTRFSYSFTPWVSLQTLIQYNDQIQNWSGNFRFGWLSTAGTGLFVVYNETQGLDAVGPLSRTFVVKYSRQFDVLR